MVESQDIKIYRLNSFNSSESVYKEEDVMGQTDMFAILNSRQ